MSPTGPDYQSIKIPKSISDALRKSHIAYDTAINEFQMILGCEALKIHSLRGGHLLHHDPHIEDGTSHLDPPRQVVFKETLLKLVRAGTNLVEVSDKHRVAMDQYNKAWRDENDRVEREWCDSQDASDFASEVAEAAKTDDTNDDTNIECDQG